MAERLQAKFGASILEATDFRGDHAVTVDRAAIREVLAFLRDDAACAFDFLMDLTAVDWLNHPQPRRERFEVVYQLYSSGRNHRLRVKVPVGAKDEVPTATPLWKTADWYEREVWDMFGLRFAGHPNLKRLLNHHEFVGHPLRKDYPVKRRQPLSANDTLMDEMDRRLAAKGLK